MKEQTAFLVLLTLTVLFSVSLQETVYMTGVIYDHHPSRNADFQYNTGEDYGMISTIIGSDRKPVMNHTGPTLTTHGPSTFNQWWRNTPDVNIVFPNISIPLSNDETPDSRVFRFADTTYFPIDGLGWGNWNNTGHNFHFCFETHGSFKYLGGEIFNFTGDDDVFVFIDNKLVVDLGGVTYARTRTVLLDELGLTMDEYYRFDFFFCLICKWRDWCGVCEGDGQSCCFDCDDGDICTISRCSVETGECQHTPKCATTNPCLDPVCSSVDGTCSTTPKDCTGNDLCMNYQCVSEVGCVSSPVSCDDGLYCTVDACQAGSCSHTFSNAICDDSLLCTNDACSNDLHCQNVEKICHDSNGCTNDGCNTDTGNCEYLPVPSCVNCNGVTCTTSNPCIPKECDPITGQCVDSPIICNDNNPCTNDTCVVQAGSATCQFTQVSCSSPDPCHPYKCKNGSCQLYDPCDDLDPCTIDSCEVSGNSPVCSHASNTCDDGAACTIDYCLPDVGCTWYTKVCPETTCQVGVCNNNTGCSLVPRNCDNSTDFCTSFACDEIVGCVAFDKVCEVDDPSCYTAECNREKQKCVETRRDTIQCGMEPVKCVSDRIALGVPEAALIGTGALAGIIVAGVAVLVIGGFLGKKGYDWNLAQRTKVLGTVQDNPLFEEASAFKANPSYNEVELL